MLVFSEYVGWNKCLPVSSERKTESSQDLFCHMSCFSIQQFADADADADHCSGEGLQRSPKGQSRIFSSVPLAEDNISDLIGVFSSTDK